MKGKKTFKVDNRPLILASIILFLICFIMIFQSNISNQSSFSSDRQEMIPQPKQKVNYQQQEQEERDITKESGKKGWVTYRNDVYGYEIDLPSGSKLLQEDANIPYKYTRIQNYDSNAEIYYGLKPGEYYLELSTYDPKLGVTMSYSCKDEMISPIRVSTNVFSGYKGRLKPGGGESAAIRYSLCIEKDSVTYYLTVSEDVSRVSQEIVNSFRFRN